MGLAAFLRSGDITEVTDVHTLIPMIVSLLTQQRFSGGAVIVTAIAASLMCCRLADPLMDMVGRALGMIG